MQTRIILAGIFWAHIHKRWPNFQVVSTSTHIYLLTWEQTSCVFFIQLVIWKIGKEKGLLGPKEEEYIYLTNATVSTWMNEYHTSRGSSCVWRDEDDDTRYPSFFSTACTKARRHTARKCLGVCVWIWWKIWKVAGRRFWFRLLCTLHYKWVHEMSHLKYDPETKVILTWHARTFRWFHFSLTFVCFNRK